MKRFQIIMLLVLVFTLMMLPFFRGLEQFPLHGDENLWLYSAKYFKLFFVDYDLENPQWFEDWAYDQPPVGKYLIGGVLHLAGYADIPKVLGETEQWNFLKGKEENISRGAMPPKEILLPVRRLMAGLGFSSCLILFGIGYALGGVRLGILAGLLLAWNPLVQNTCRRAMPDAALLFFLLASVAAIFLFYRRMIAGKFKEAFLFCVLHGVLSALAAGTKYSGGLSMIVLASFMVYLCLVIGLQSLFFKRDERLNRENGKLLLTVLTGFLLSGFFAFVCFVGLNPYLYHETLEKLRYMIGYRHDIICFQQSEIGPALLSVSERLPRVYWRIFYPPNYVVIGNLFKFPAELYLFVLGIGCLMWNEIKMLWHRWLPSEGAILLLWVIIAYGGISLWIPLDWDRYYLPIIPGVTLVVAFAIEALLRGLSRAAEMVLERRQNS
ncbi:MAG: phospholipid carrier-dependent glycosyltransferase [Candidatus Omnitrophica bacterium]|nr:phospholipid carrier-dependent glycosyltransferase [Candidatus Omnitrophota bacterium]